MVLSIPLFAMSERHQSKQVNLASAKKEIVREVDPRQVSPDNNNELIHCRGEPTVEGLVYDTEFGLRPKKVMRLRRKVEMFQWV